MIWDQSNYIWPEGKNSAACFSVDVDANAPYLWQYRNKLPKTIAIADHRQYGMRVGLARIVKMLDSISIKGSFFVPGVVAEDTPDLLPWLIQRGPEIADRPSQARPASLRSLVHKVPKRRDRS